MAEAPSIPVSENGDPNDRDHHELFLPIANVLRIIKKGLPADAQIAKDAKEAVQDCVSVFVSFITSEATECCREDKRQTLYADDVLSAMKTLGFEDYVGPLKAYLKKFREIEGGNHVQSIKDHDGSVRKEGVQLQPHQGNSQSQGDYVRSIKDHDGSVRKEGVQLQPHQGNSQSQNTIGKTQSEGDVEAVDETQHIMMDLKESGYTAEETIGKTQGEGDVEAVDETQHIMMDLKESGYTAEEIAAAICEDEWIGTLVNFE